MAKKKPNRKKTTAKRTRRKNSSRHSALKLFSFLFVIVLLSVAGLFYLKDAFVKKDEAEKKSAQLESKISQIDSSLKEYLFDSGISSEELKMNVAGRMENGVEWNFKEGKASVKTPGFDEISNGLEKLTTLNNITLNIRESTEELTAEISAFGFLTHRLKFRPAEQKKPGKKQVAVKKSVPPGEPEPPAPEKQNKSVKKPKIVIIVDDVGQSKKAIDKLVKIDFPLNFAVLPYLPYSEYAARAAYRSGKEVMLHLPMEPKYSSGYTAEDAGKGALVVGHPIEEINSQLIQNLGAVPYIKGVNNHMGSKFTENRELMELVLGEIRERNLYFVDSLTSNSSYGESVSRKMGIKFAKRDVFLDNSKKGKQYMVKQLDKLVEMAEKNGFAVGICHTYPESIEILSEYLPKINGRVEVSTVTSIFN